MNFKAASDCTDTCIVTKARQVEPGEYWESLSVIIYCNWTLKSIDNQIDTPHMIEIDIVQIDNSETLDWLRNFKSP